MASGNEKNSVRRPCGLLYWLAVFCARVWFTLFWGLRLDRSGVRDIKGPVLLLCNHESNYDFLLCAMGFPRIRFNFMVTTFFFHSSALARLLRLMGCIPKKQFVPDAGAVRSVLAVARRGGSVCIFPEGQVCYSGAANDMDLSVAKLVKKLGITTVAASVRGNYMSCPKWACGAKFPSRVEWSAKVLFTPEQLETASVEAIGDAVLRALDYDEFEWQRARRYRARRSRSTAGLEAVLYRCPACGADRAMKSNGGRRLVCEKCGYDVTLNDECFFERDNGQAPVFDSISDWFRAEQAALAADADAGRFPLVSPCTLYKTIEGKHGYTLCGAGTMTLDGTGLHFSGEQNGAPFAVEALYEHQTTLTHNAAQCGVDVPGADANYLMAPQDKRELFRFVEGYSLLRRRRDAAHRANGGKE